MLTHLHISNYTLIDKLDIDFHQGFSVITGETGAGKSIILGAIGLLLGNRAEARITPKEGKCTIEAVFDLRNYDFRQFFTDNDLDYDDECILRREISSTGKSRAFINDTPAPLQLMKQLGMQLVDIHSQHQNLLLSKEDFQQNVLDIIAGNSQQLTAFRSAFNSYQQSLRELKALKEQIENDKKNIDFISFQAKELASVDLEDGIQEELEQEQKTLSHAESIKTALYQADTLLNGDETGIVQQLRDAASQLHDIEDVFPQVKDLAARLDSAHIEVQDIAEEVSSDTADINFDPAQLDDINSHLDAIYALEQKYHVETVAELLSLREKLAQQLSNIDNSDEQLEALSAEVEKKLQTCQKAAEALSKERKKAAQKVEKEMRERLVPLGMPSIRFSVDMSRRELSPSGFDKIVFLFSANKSTPMQPVADIASGGEIARVMLALKAMISGAVKLPTIIFDEIDTGVSGKIAQKMGQIMAEMGHGGRQVISITHLPQIAALGSSHYKVEKTETPSGTRTSMHELSKDERVEEIAKMLSGEDVTPAALDNARALLKQ